MIIKCEKCLTKFRLDDAKVAEKDVKVRCSKCKHVFAVSRLKSDTGLPEAAGAAAAVGLQQAASSALPEMDPRTHPDLSLENEAFAEQDRQASTGFTLGGSESTITGPGDETFSFSTEQEPSDTASGQSFSSAEGADVDFTSFDFGDSAAEQTVAAPSTPFEIPAAVERPAIPQGLDFSGDDMFGEVVPPKAEEPEAAISFDFGTDSFEESIDMGSLDAVGNDSGLSLGTTGEVPFSLGDIDFGDELTSVAVQQVNPDELKPSQELLFAPLAEAQPKPADSAEPGAGFGGGPASTAQELPPLSIASRRKQSPLFGGLIAVVGLLVVGILGYVGFTNFSTDKTTAREEAGTISLQAVKAVYIHSKVAGKLLAISGEARNGYAKPRAALQVKGLVYDGTGQVLTSKQAYCGNPLTDEQVATLPLEKIEAAMANQFGDSLGNLEVAPGKVVPFTVVIPMPAKGAKDFGVEVVGSTVAAGKQQ